MKNNSIVGITPLKTLMPVLSAEGYEKSFEAVLAANKKLTELHDFIQLNVQGSRERALVLTKLEEVHHWLMASQAG